MICAARSVKTSSLVTGDLSPRQALVFAWLLTAVSTLVLGLLTTAQFARPGADQLMIMIEEAFVSGHGLGHQGGG